jgi:hypothetical protein
MAVAVFGAEIGHMPKALNEFTLTDWLHLRPIVHNYKHARFLAIYAVVLRRPPLVGHVDRIIAAARGRRVLTTIAFHDPAKAALQVKAVSEFVPDCLHLIADNSIDDKKAEAIQRAATDGGAQYIRLPRGPWTGLDAGLGHGLGMTWVWRNIVKPARPQAFGFVDHDIYPTTEDDPFAHLQHYPVAGTVCRRPPKWHLWAGFCFFRFDYVADRRLSFIRDWLAGLDTGGGNWNPLHRHLDPSKVPDTGPRRDQILPGVPETECSVSWHGTWLHEGTDWRYLGGPLPRDFAADKFAAVAKIVRERLASAGDLHVLR